jgi:hypothetical protein
MIVRKLDSPRRGGLRTFSRCANPCRSQPSRRSRSDTMHPSGHLRAYMAQLTRGVFSFSHRVLFRSRHDRKVRSTRLRPLFSRCIIPSVETHPHLDAQFWNPLRLEGRQRCRKNPIHPSHLQRLLTRHHARVRPNLSLPSPHLLSPHRRSQLHHRIQRPSPPPHSLPPPASPRIEPATRSISLKYLPEQPEIPRPLRGAEQLAAHRNPSRPFLATSHRRRPSRKSRCGLRG